MIIDSEIIEELYNSAGIDRQERAKKYVLQKRVNITKVIFNDSENFEIRSKVRGNNDIYSVYIKVDNNEIEDLSCTCPDYYEHYGTCKHILATVIEFNSNQEYIKIFSGEPKKNISDIELYRKNDKDEEKYRNFRQLINAFYPDNEQLEKINNDENNNYSIRIEPRIIYSTYYKNLKLDLKIGNEQLYKLKNLPEFYDRMLNGQYYKYGKKLEFIHEEKSFKQSSIPLLKYVLKYAEIIKYANESTNNYSYYGRTIEDNYITLSNTGMDELFEILNEQEVLFEIDDKERKVLFSKNEPNIKFDIEKEGKREYYITPNIDIYEYDVILGKKYVYFLYDNVLYQCDKSFKENTLKLLEIFRANFSSRILFKEEDFSKLFSVVFPKVKNNLNIDNIDKENIEKYMPQELFVKVFLDINEKKYITANIKFIYGDIEFNPLVEEDKKTARDVIKEDRILEMFRIDGFMLDIHNSRLILVDDDKIYSFLSQRVEEYMKKFEVLATESFKNKEIRQPRIGNLGVRIENNLLKLDFSDIDFNISELKEIMQKYKLKKKYHRLKDGSYISLEKNETIDFFDNITKGMDVSYSQIESGELKLPIYRSLYLDKILENIKLTNIVKNKEYKKIINNIENREVSDEIELPLKLNASLRQYQKIGFKWLNTLDSYKLGGILADDMGLGKTIQILAVILKYVQSTKDKKSSIVVCPSSLSLNWENEIKKFTPSLKSMVMQGSVEERKDKLKNISKYDIIITSYDLLKRDIELYKELNYEFKYIIADEAQYIKNSNTQNAKSIKEISSEVKFALTGTPIENSLSELWSIFDFIMPGYLFAYRKFKEQFETPIVKEEDTEAMKKLKMLIQPFILRRVKTEVLTELPDKTISILNNEMQEEQLKIYLSYMRNAKNEAMEEINQNGIKRSQIKILALLMRLRQICCHPSLFIENYVGESSKLNQCMEVIKDATDSGHKILLFSSYTGMFSIIEKELKKENIKYYKLTGQTKVGERIKLVDEFNENEEIKIFLISLKAGGTGLNLIGADMVIHYDPWWNLSAENQATDRTYRIGQKKNVQVYKLITKNSIEEKIYQLQEKKSKLIDNMLSINETFINKLSKEDIIKLFE